MNIIFDLPIVNYISTWNIFYFTKNISSITRYFQVLTLTPPYSCPTFSPKLPSESYCIENPSVHRLTYQVSWWFEEMNLQTLPGIRQLSDIWVHFNAKNSQKLQKHLNFNLYNSWAIIYLFMEFKSSSGQVMWLHLLLKKLDNLNVT